MPEMYEKNLMRETATINFPNGSTADRAVAFDIDIPEGYVMEIHKVEFLLHSGANPVANDYVLYLTDDPDETASPGHTAQKTIASTIILFNLTTSGRDSIILRDEINVFRTQLVVNPSFIGYLSNDPGASVNAYCRIWFDFVKVSPSEILELLRQQQY